MKSLMIAARGASACPAAQDYRPAAWEYGPTALDYRLRRAAPAQDYGPTGLDYRPAAGDYRPAGGIMGFDRALRAGIRD